MTTVTQYVVKCLKEEETKKKKIKNEIDDVKSEFMVSLLKNENAENYYANEKRIQKAIDALAEDIHNLEKLGSNIIKRPGFVVDQTKLNGVNKQITVLSEKKRTLIDKFKTIRENRPTYLIMIIRIKERRLYELEKRLKNRLEKYQIEDKARKEYQDRYVKKWRETHGQNKLKS